MLGVKNSKIHHGLGQKSSKSSQSLGVKDYKNETKTNRNINPADSKDGLENNSNSTAQYQEPKKFNAVVVKSPNYTNNIQHSSIEKQRKEKPKDKHNHFI